MSDIIPKITMSIHIEEGASSTISEPHFDDVEELEHLVSLFKRSLVSLGFMDKIINEYFKETL